MNGRGIRDQAAVLRVENQRLDMSLKNLMRLVMQILIEHGDETSELTISHMAANSLAMERSTIDTAATADGRMAVRYRDTILEPTPNAGGPRLVAPAPEPVATAEPEPKEDAAPPCSCSHDRTGHLAGIGKCRLGSCLCGGYDPAVVPIG